MTTTVAMGVDGDGGGGGGGKPLASATNRPPQVPQPRQQQQGPACSSCVLTSQDDNGAEEGEYPLTPIDDDARSALVDEILKACEPGDPVLASICRLLKSVLGVPMASVTLISHAQAWFRGGEGADAGAGGEGAGGGGGEEGWIRECPG